MWLMKFVESMEKVCSGDGNSPKSGFVGGREESSASRGRPAHTPFCPVFSRPSSLMTSHFHPPNHRHHPHPFRSATATQYQPVKKYTPRHALSRLVPVGRAIKPFHDPRFSYLGLDRASRESLRRGAKRKFRRPLVCFTRYLTTGDVGSLFVYFTERDLKSSGCPRLDGGEEVCVCVI